ncbi:MAG: hypothetical protein IJI45_15730 [Anaerolineaceae bacterium]|nr:hypothetical protein [Anaerolineaceae bacterium]
MSKCPICGQEYSSPPAVSRIDNKTPICPSCGVRQALSAAGIDEDVQNGIVSLIEVKQAEYKEHAAVN